MVACGGSIFFARRERRQKEEEEEEEEKRGGRGVGLHIYFHQDRGNRSLLEDRKIYSIVLLRTLTSGAAS